MAGIGVKQPPGDARRHDPFDYLEVAHRTIGMATERCSASACAGEFFVTIGVFRRSASLMTVGVGFLHGSEPSARARSGEKQEGGAFRAP